ncbi:MAG TPA: AgmX/PglI C-terminal domain-containing protein [Polyangia bacterium]|nr:AgmX/PglI C-terminal domain-containing protein [Polyangia bacterium]
MQISSFVWLLMAVLSEGPVGTQAAAPPGQSGPSLYETGRVAGSNVAGTGLRIEQTRANRPAPRETPVAAVDETEHPSAPSVAGVIDRTALSREIHARFALLNSCPGEVARRAHVVRAGLRASRLVLRWTILPSGQVAETGVVAAAPADVRVMDCVKKQMNVWSFARPRDGSVRVERPFRFR